MSADHVIKWEFDRDAVSGELVCNATPGSDCRLESIDPECQCESWHIQVDEDGRKFHVAGDDYCDPESDAPRHYMRDSGESKWGPHCNVALFINEGELLESADGKPTFVIGTTPVEPVWMGDYYDWKPVAS